MKVLNISTNQTLTVPKMEEKLLDQIFGKGNYEVLEVGTSNKLDSEEKLSRLKIADKPEDRKNYLEGLKLIEAGLDLWEKVDCKYEGTKTQVGRGVYFQNPDKIPANLQKKVTE